MVQPLGLLERASLTLAATTAAGVLVEAIHLAPGLGDPGFLILLAAWLFVLTSLWALPIGGLLIGAQLVVARLWPRREADPARDLSWLVWVGPVALACVSAGRGVLVWSRKAFVRQDLAAAVTPLLLLLVYAGFALAALLLHRLVRRRLATLRRGVVLAIAAASAAAAAAVHLARYPVLLDDQRVPILLEVGAIGGLAAALVWRLPTWPWRWRRPRWYLLAGHGAALAICAIVCLFGGQIAPLRFPIVQAVVQTEGLAAAPAARALASLADRDGDGFSHWFGGLDCDDGDAEVQPLGRDLPGDGVDQDCFGGDLSRAEVDADLAARAARRRTGPRRVDNVILIAVDTLRADALGYAGADHPSSPNLDRLAGRATVFREAYTQAPMTRRAFPALLAGRFPSNIHWLDLHTSYKYTVSHADNVYLAEVLEAAGLSTALAIAFNYAQRSRFDQGFGVKHVFPASKSKQEKNADKIVDAALGYLRGRAAPGGNPGGFFLWMHFYEPHYPYVRHAGAGDFGGSARQRYLSEVHWVDSQLGRLFDELETLGLAGTTAIIVTADHGEEFGEHGGETHGDLFPEDLRIPMLVAVPGGAPREIDTPVALIDVAPTIAELFGVPAPDSFDGRSLVPFVDGADPPGEPVFAELIPDAKVPRRAFTVIDGGWQLIVDFKVGSRELYHLASDRFAKHNRLGDDPAQAARLDAILRRQLALRMGHLVISHDRPGGGAAGDGDE